MIEKLNELDWIHNKAIQEKIKTEKIWNDEEIDYYLDELECHGAIRTLEIIRKDFNCSLNDAVGLIDKYIYNYDKIKLQKLKEILK